jgi:hypothetical protein
VSVRIARRGAIAASRVAPAGGNVLYLDLPGGSSGNYASTPDAAANSLTDNIDFRAKIALTDWTPSLTTIAQKWPVSASTDRSWCFIVTDSLAGELALMYSTTGSNLLSARSAVACGFTDGAVGRVRFTKSGTELKFYTSADWDPATDTGTWTQLGTTKTVTAGLFDSTQALKIGGNFVSFFELDGNVYYAELRSGIGGTVVAKFDPTTVTRTAVRTPTSFVASTGETWTMNGTGWDWVT